MASIVATWGSSVICFSSTTNKYTEMNRSCSHIIVVLILILEITSTISSISIRERYTDDTILVANTIYGPFKCFKNRGPGKNTSSICSFGITSPVHIFSTLAATRSVWPTIFARDSAQNCYPTHQRSRHPRNGVRLRLEQSERNENVQPAQRLQQQQ